MQPSRPLFYVYGNSPNSEPLDEGTALYCREWISEDVCNDYKWDPKTNKWVKSKYLGRLLSRGEPTLDQVDGSELPSWLPWPR